MNKGRKKVCACFQQMLCNTVFNILLCLNFFFHRSILGATGNIILTPEILHIHTLYSIFADTNKSVVGSQQISFALGANNMVTDQSGMRTSNLSITILTC
jgi:hypothetical protein